MAGLISPAIKNTIPFAAHSHLWRHYHSQVNPVADRNRDTGIVLTADQDLLLAL